MSSSIAAECVSHFAASTVAKFSIPSWQVPPSLKNVFLHLLLSSLLIATIRFKPAHPPPVLPPSTVVDNMLEEWSAGTRVKEGV
jgi:hypothetical protein